MKRLPLILSLAVTFALALALRYGANPAGGRPQVQLPQLGFWEDERTDGTYFTIVDANGDVIDKTARVVYPGDELITEDNRHYRVARVVGDTAYAELLGRVRLDWRAEDAGLVGPQGAIPVQGGQRNLIAVYHTHSDESYVPTDGTQSRPGDGGIFKVGEVFVEKLRSMGVNVDYNKQPHEPHDADAYRRSRRTAFRLLQKAPAAIVDVHRDGIPDSDVYEATVAGQRVAKVRLVVGRQNQNMGANLDFAKRLKAYLDEKYPGLVRGIFIAHGNYNQDLSPRSILVEAGTYTNSRELAQRGAAFFAEALPRVLGIAVTPSRYAPGVAGARADWSGILWIILAVIGAGLGFLWLSTGSVRGARERLQDFFAREWGSLPRPRRTSRPLRAVGGRVRKPLIEEKLVSRDGEAPKNDQRGDYQKD